MADQIVLLRDGHIEQDASPAEVYARPATSFAASFIGTPPMNLFPLEQRGGGMVLRGTDGPVLASAIEGDVLGGIRPEHLRLAERGIPATVRHAEYLGADTVVACCGWRCDAAGATARPRGARRRRGGVSRHRRTDPSVRCGIRATDRAHIARRRRLAHDQDDPPRTGAGHRRDVGDAWHRPRGRRDGDQLLLPGRRRWADHEDHRRLCGRLPARESVDQGDADLCRHLPGHADQGADGAEGERRAAAGGAAVDRCVLADRRRSDRAVRYGGEQRRGSCLAAQLLSGVPEERRDRRAHLGRSVPALDHRAVLEQGGVPGGRAQSGSAAGHLGRACRVRGEADQAERRRGRAVGRADSVDRLCLLAVPGARDRGWRNARDRRMARRPTSPVPPVSRRCATGSICRANIMRIRLASSNGERRRAISWSRRWR